NISVCQFLNVLTTELNAVRELLSTVSNHLYKFSLTLLESLVLNHSWNAFFKRYASARSGCNFSNSCTRAFHFMRQGYWALDSVRREVQHTLTRSDRLVSKRSKKLLWLAPEKLDQKGKARVQELLKLHPDLAEAYRLKNALHEWFKTSDSSNVKENLYKWFETVESSSLTAFNSVVKTFKNWQTEILNAFVFPYNNGYIEGVNNTTKVIKRMSYGIKSFDRLRKKILFRQAIRSAA